MMKFFSTLTGNFVYTCTVSPLATDCKRLWEFIADLATLGAQLCGVLSPHICPTSLSLRSYLPRKHWWLSGKESACQYKTHGRCQFDPWVRKILWRRKWQPAPVFLPGKSHGQRSLASYSTWGCKESDTTEHAHHIIVVIIKY